MSNVDPFAKIDMSLDDIIKLNKKEKKKNAAAAQKAKNPAPKKLTAAQRRRAESLKLKARNTRINKLRQQKGQKVQTTKNASSFGTATQRPRRNAAKKNIRSKNNVGMTRGGRVNPAKQQQFRQQRKNQIANRGVNNKQGPQQQRGPVRFPKIAGRPSIKDRLGARLNIRKNNQRQKRQQMTNRNRQGLVPVQASKRGGKRHGGPTNFSRRQNFNESGRNQMTQSINRQYNQQPRRTAGQQTRGRGAGRQNQRNNNNKSSTNNRSLPNFNNKRGRGGGRGRGRAANQRKVTLY
uniref:UAP56-interacting factor-like n=1 Tax=Styela clava TaxID=7725 RepID=UPI00193936A5|nr:UAP56-interacting factor-like [Styela clava]